MRPVVDIAGLNFAYPGGPTVLRDIDFSMNPAETVALVGPNGAGKSTLLFHLNGLLPETNRPLPSDDTGVWIDGIKVTADRLPDIRRRVGLVFQDPDDQLFCPTLLEDVLFGPLHQGVPPQEARVRAMDALRVTGLEGLEDRPPHQLSVGQRKRACVAGVLACQPVLWVLDEPTSHLDPRGRRELIDLLRRIEGPKIIATHDLEMVLDLANRVVIVDGGRIHADGRPFQILADPDLMERHGLEVPAGIRHGRQTRL